MLKLFIIGIIVGIANVMPGVSGGTLAIILGVYDKLTEAVGNFLFVPLKKKIEYAKFLLQIGIGIFIGIILFSNIVEYCFINYPKGTGIAFSLLIIPSIPFIVKGEEKNTKNIVSLILGMLFTLIFVIGNMYFGDNNTTTNLVIDTKYLIKLFLCGCVAAGAMIIPGISGSLLLLMLGEYANILSFVNGFFIQILKKENYINLQTLLEKSNFFPLTAFTLGVIIGVVIVSKIINYFLNRYRGVTLFFITGIVIISVFQIWINIFNITL